MTLLTCMSMENVHVVIIFSQVSSDAVNVMNSNIKISLAHGQTLVLDLRQSFSPFDCESSEHLHLWFKLTCHQTVETYL